MDRWRCNEPIKVTTRSLANGNESTLVRLIRERFSTRSKNNNISTPNHQLFAHVHQSMNMKSSEFRCRAPVVYDQYE
ncbi:hypothetical protein CDAR_495121 [Caerostris darwini]|uniref:Uncharacterized protein n=1 Tax=Caerostris darwini TaxID=1538125 RepID=A0AAV4PWC5_9ARAC|nr:hypothetical protein CDAR_495121 [Caerostris darwini]